MLGQRQPGVDARGRWAHDEGMLRVGDDEVAHAGGLGAHDQGRDPKHEGQQHLIEV